MGLCGSVFIQKRRDEVFRACVCMYKFDDMLCVFVVVQRVPCGVVAVVWWLSVKKRKNSLPNAGSFFPTVDRHFLRHTLP